MVLVRAEHTLNVKPPTNRNDGVVLLVTASYDEAPNYVAAALDRLHVPYLRLDTDLFPKDVRIGFQPGSAPQFTSAEGELDGTKIRSVWYRRNVNPELPDDLDAGVRDFCERETRAFLNGVLATLPTSRWMSSPSRLMEAERKPYQLHIAQKVGFKLPRTLSSNDKTSLVDFANRRPIIAKAISSGYIRTADG